MTGWALAATIIIAAAVGTLTALLTDAMRTAARTWDADRARMNAEVDTEREQRHLAGIHIRRGGKGPCVVCGANEGVL